MNSNDNNLLTFLKKQSLFSNSPSKNISKKRSSRSKQKMLERQNKNIHLQKSVNENPINNRRLFHRPSEQNFPELQDNYSRNFSPIQNVNLKHSPLGDSRYKTFEDFEDRRQTRNPQQKMYENRPKDNNQFWTGLVSYTTSFQSAKVESIRCLQSLSQNVRTELTSINYKIQNFNSKMLKAINFEFQNLRERINKIVEQSFRDSEKYIREYMKSQQDKLAGDLIKMKEVLQKEYTKIETMKEEIAKPHWRKVAGEIIASQLQTSIDKMIKQSAALEIGRWELGDLVGYRLKDLQKDLRDIVRLKRQNSV